jgi:hypothetical protein
MNSEAMSRASRGLPLRFVALAVLLAVAGVLVAGVALARHHHDGPGLYNDRCPLEALATFDRSSSSGIVAAVTATPVEVATTLVVPVLVARLGLPAAADARLRAPPAR